MGCPHAKRKVPSAGKLLFVLIRTTQYREEKLNLVEENGR
jgi:hypothetical protein